MKGRIGLSVYERAVINHMVLKEKIDLSVIITAHNEGHIAHRTMLSIFRACEELEKKKVPYEILVHIDNGDNKTKEYFSRYKNNPKIRLVESDFKDLSSSRNYAAKVARGDHVSFVDADDLISKNWLIDAYTLVRKHPKRIARFSYFLTFGGEVTILTENTTKFAAKGEDLLYCFDSNRYSASILCKRSLILELPQRKNTPPYGYEDWQWLLDTIAFGAENVIVPNTVYFYRKDARAKESLLESQNSSNNIISPVKVFSFSALKKYSKEIGAVEKLEGDQKKIKRISLFRIVKNLIKRILYNLLVFAGKFSIYQQIHDKLFPAAETVPEWLIDEWKAINKIEKTTFPTREVLKNIVLWEPNRMAGIAYMNIINMLKKEPDTLFFVPWLIRGGADKVFINTANALKENWNVVVLQSEKSESFWRDKLASEIDFIDLYEILKKLDENTAMRLLALFVSQTKIKRIIIGNSKLAYDFTIRYRTLIEELNIKIYVYAFCPYVAADGRIGGYAFEELPLIQNYAYKIITDNSIMARDLKNENAIDPTKLFIQYQYLENDFRQIAMIKNKKTEPLRILWASRVSREKFPEMLVKISQELNLANIKFKIDVYGPLERPYKRSFFRKAGNNLSYRGLYNSIEDLDVEGYDLFLYTTRSDGLPNILLEMGSLGLPIIAPDIGGVCDLIQDGKTGILIKNHASVDEYLLGIKKLQDPTLREKLAIGCQERIRKHFTKKQWDQSIKDIFDK